MFNHYLCTPAKRVTANIGPIVLPVPTMVKHARMSPEQ